MSLHRLLEKRQQADLESFFVSDSSPIFQYSTFGNGAPAWEADFAPQPDGFDETFHLTSTSNAQLSFGIYATSLSFLVPHFDNCATTVSINGSSPIKACSTAVGSGDLPFTLPDLPLGLHQVTWSAGALPSNQQVVFWGVDATRPNAPAGHANVTLDDTFASSAGATIKYEGAWDHLGPQNTGGSASGSLNGTLSMTRTQGSKVTFSGAVYLYGSVGPDYGSASVALNGKMVAANMNLQSPWDMEYQLLWFQTGLDASLRSEVTMTSLESGKMSLDFVVLTSGPDTLSKLAPSASTPFTSTLTGRLVLGLVIPIVVLAILGIALFLVCARRRRPRAPPSFDIDGEANFVEHKAETPVDSPHWSDTNSPVADEVFVSYSEALGQRMSDRWTPTSNQTFDPDSPTVRPDDQSSRLNSPSVARRSGGTNSTARGSWSRPIRSLLGSSAPTTPIVQRRNTKLPPYSPTDSARDSNTTSDLSESTLGSQGRSVTPWPSAAAEKSNLARPQNRRSGLQSRLNSFAPSRLDRHASTVAPSSILSVFGAPPSVRHPSMRSAFPSDADEPPEVPSPAIISDILKHTPSLEFTLPGGCSIPSPLSPVTPSSRNGDNHELRRNHSLEALSIHSSASCISEARPDSAVMPSPGASLSSRR